MWGGGVKSAVLSLDPSEQGSSARPGELPTEVSGDWVLMWGDGEVLPHSAQSGLNQIGGAHALRGNRIVPPAMHAVAEPQLL